MGRIKQAAKCVAHVARLCSVAHRSLLPLHLPSICSLSPDETHIPSSLCSSWLDVVPLGELLSFRYIYINI